MTGMMRMASWILGLALLAGCGGGAEEQATTDPSPTATSSSPSSSPTPHNVESNDCRESVATADAIAIEMETGAVAAEEFTKLFDRLTVLQNRVGRDCSVDVARPFAKALYHLAKANLWYTLCDVGSPCGDNRAERYLLKGTTLVHKARTVSDQTV